MYKLNRILICLDLSDTDKDILKSINIRSRYFPIDHITFLHVTDTLELPDEIRKKYPDLLAPIDETVKKIIEDNLEQYFERRDNVEYDIEVVEGKPTAMILKWASIKDADLILLGRKHRDHGSGVLTEKIARIAHCSVAILPVEIKEGINNRIMVPIDFSENSQMAVEIALKTIDMVGAGEIICLHAYHVPTGYHSTGKSFEEFAEIMKHNSERDFKIFLKHYFPGHEQLSCIHELDTHNNPAKLAHDIAVREEVDFIFMGSKGRTGLSSLLLGSICEKMIKYDIEIPLLIIKDKTDQFGFLDAIMKL